jgi:hypothetical protein
MGAREVVIAPNEDFKEGYIKGYAAAILVAKSAVLADVMEILNDLTEAIHNDNLKEWSEGFRTCLISRILQWTTDIDMMEVDDCV